MIDEAGSPAAGSPAADTPRVALVGPVHMDLFLRGSAPLDRQALNQWVGPSDIDLVVAGSLGYTAMAMSRLGVRVELHTCLGDDAFADHIRSALIEAGIDATHVGLSPGATAIGVYMLFWGGAKRPLTYRLPGFEPWPDPPRVLRDGDLPPHLLHSGGLLHFPSMWQRGLADAFERARRAGVRTSIDSQFPLTEMPAPWAPHIADVLAHADILLCDDHESAMLFDVADRAAALRAGLASGPSIVVVKRGAQGALGSDGSVIVDQPGVNVPEAAVRESVGAGDAFDAGFLDAVVRGRSLAEAMIDGTATAALTLSARGRAEGVIDRDAVAAMRHSVPTARIASA